MPLLSFLVIFLAAPLWAAPVHDAARAGDVITVATLVDNDPAVTPDLPTTGGNTPLLEAAKAEKPEVIRFLLVRGADPNRTNSEGYSALLYAVERGNLPLARLLLGSGASVNMRNKKGYTPLILAAYAGRLDLVTLLVDWGADPAFGGGNGVTAEVYAVNFPEVAEFLKQRKNKAR